jgi:hypothetical protein
VHEAFSLRDDFGLLVFIILLAFSLKYLVISYFSFVQYPTIVPLQAIVGQGAAQAPTQEQQAAAAAAALTAVNPNAAPPGLNATVPSQNAPAQVVAAGSGGLGAFNPMAWLGAGGQPPGTGNNQS